MNVLSISPFPFKKGPLHGGQLRVRAVYNFFKTLGYTVKSIGVRTYDVYPECEGFLPSPQNNVAKVWQGSPHFYIYGMGQLFYKCDEFYRQLRDKITEPPDIVVVEHPWLFQFAERYISSLVRKPLLIYDAHNIEYRMKAQAVKHEENHEVQAVKELEIYAARHSDVTLSVSPEEREWLVRHGSRCCLLTPNGIDIWDKKIHLEQAKKFALFIGSDHFPNVNGFKKYFGGVGFGALKRDEQVYVVGGVSSRLEQERFHFAVPGLKRHLRMLGRVSDENLSKLRNDAHVFVLPLDQGAGSNLKTAEAIYANKYIIATRKAFQAYERFLDLPGIFIVESPEEFKNKLREVMTLPPLLDVDHNVERSSVLWDAQFGELKTWLLNR